MKYSPETFDFIYYTDSKIGSPIFEGSTLKFSIGNIALPPEHPLNGEPRELILKSCTMVFEGVVRSERLVDEYIGPPQDGNFKPRYRITDGPFVNLVIPKDQLHMFGLEGFQITPAAFIDWEIKALSYAIEDPVPKEPEE